MGTILARVKPCRQHCLLQGLARQKVDEIGISGTNSNMHGNLIGCAKCAQNPPEMTSRLKVLLVYGNKGWLKKVPASAQGRCDPVTYPRHLNTKKGGVDPRGYVLKLHPVIGLSVAICFSYPHGRCPPLTLPSVALPFTFYLS